MIKISREIDCWLDLDWYDELAEYYNEHHDEIREKNIRNFGHWIGALAINNLHNFKRLLELENIEKESELENIEKESELENIEKE